MNIAIPNTAILKSTLFCIVYAMLAMCCLSTTTAGTLGLTSNPTMDTVHVPPDIDKRYVFIKLDEGDDEGEGSATLAFAVAPSATLGNLSWTFDGGEPGTAQGNGPHPILYEENDEGVENNVTFSSNRTDSEDNTCETSPKITARVVIPKIEYQQTAGTGSLTAKIKHPLNLSFDAYIGIVNGNDVAFHFTPTSIPSAEVKWSGLQTGTGHSITVSSPSSGNEVLTVKSFTHTFKVKAATVTGPGKNLWGLANLDKFRDVQRYGGEASVWAAAYPFGDTSTNENKTDAARHCYWNAITAAEYSSTVAIEASTAYEVSNLGDTGYGRNSICMDMHNNAKGASIGSSAGVTTRTVLQASVVSSLVAGELLTLRRPSSSGQNELLIPSDQPYAP